MKEEYEHGDGIGLNCLQELIEAPRGTITTTATTTTTGTVSNNNNRAKKQQLNNNNDAALNESNPITISNKEFMIEDNVYKMMKFGYFFPKLKTNIKTKTDEVINHSNNQESLPSPVCSNASLDTCTALEIAMNKEEEGLGLGLGFGLRNKGQICFMNSILQALVPLKSFILYLKLIKEREGSATDNNKMVFVHALYDMLTSLAGPNRGSNLLDGVPILHLVGSKHQQFSSSKHPLLQQQDAQEFFQAVMTMTTSDAEHAYSSLNFYPSHNPLFTTSSALWFLLKKPNPLDLKPSIHHNKESLFKEEKKQHDYDEPSPSNTSSTEQISYPRSIQILLSSTPPSITGWIGQMLKCATCNHTKPIQNTPFYDIPILPNAHNSTIQQSLKQFFGIECIANVECYSCTLTSQINTQQLELQCLNKAIDRRQLRYGSQSHYYDGLLQERQHCLQLIHTLQSKDPDDENDQNHNTLNLLKSNAYKSLFISRLPPILILHIQRKYYNPQRSTMIKSSNHVSFSLFIDISPFLLHSSTSSNQQNTNPNKILYQCISVVEHIGNASSGHYQTFRRSITTNSSSRPPEKDTWIRCSDEIIEYVTWERVRQVQAYMLFYEAV